MAITSHNTLALPKQTRGVLSATVWAELYDFLSLARDALGERPEDFDEIFLLNAVANQRRALRICHGVMQRRSLDFQHSTRRLDRLADHHQPRGQA